eukprot:10217338-Lingulodinium_polyedra.AAC.1
MAFKKETFKTATDWIVEVTPGVHVRYTCAWCVIMPVKSSDFYRMTKERTPGTDTINAHGNWASP